MSCWLTVHHPPERGTTAEELRFTGIWVPRAWSYKVERMSADDGVVIYETLSGPPRVLHFPDGASRRSFYEKGRSGIVAVGRILRTCPDAPVTVAEQDDGKRIEWVKLAEVEVQSRDGFVDRFELNRILGYKPNAPMLGGGGTRPIDPAAFQQIAAAFSL